MSEAVLARDYYWLDKLESGEAQSIRDLARQLGISCHTIEEAVSRARNDRRLVDQLRAAPRHRYSPRTPLFGCKPFTPSTTCADVHPGGLIPRGSMCVCMVCHQDGGGR